MSEGRIWINGALLCQSIMREVDDSITFVRILDTLTMSVDLSEIYSENGLRKLKEGCERSYDLSYAVTIAREGDINTAEIYAIATGPSGLVTFLAVETVTFEPDIIRIVLSLNLSLSIIAEGTAWIETFINNELVAKTPLRIVFELVEAAQATQP